MRRRADTGAFASGHAAAATKTATSMRTISIQPELAAVCRKISADKKRRSLMYGFRTYHFFCDDDGRRVSYDAYRIYLERHTKNLLGRQLSPHALRHTHVAMLAKSGVPLVKNPEPVEHPVRCN
ncbi:hypothetical protein ACTQ1N_12490 [Porcincola sp. LCP21S3_C12]|uniref:hypothetical protein n=1 Tax=Porcincola sp. LCP21S3_C12 TaxID=3438798 RepID=UPI003F9B9C70